MTLLLAGVIFCLSVRCVHSNYAEVRCVLIIIVSLILRYALSEKRLISTSVFATNYTSQSLVPIEWINSPNLHAVHADPVAFVPLLLCNQREHVPSPSEMCNKSPLKVKTICNGNMPMDVLGVVREYMIPSNVSPAFSSTILELLGGRSGTRART